MGRKPILTEIQKYIDSLNPLGLKGASITTISERNHLIYRLEKDGETYALRMINPESYRRGEWINMAEEYQILKALEPTGLGPKVYYLLGPKGYHLDGKSSPPFLIQEFVEAKCFNELKPLSQEHLVGTARAIALLNSRRLTSENLSFLKKYEEQSYKGRILVWQYRLLYACLYSLRRDVIRWALKIEPLLFKARNILSNFERLLPHAEFTFHFDGAHCGNTYWRDGKVIFLDWQKVSYRNDPTFTLVRFATSVGGKGEVPKAALDILVKEYLRARAIPNFSELAQARLIERQVSDLVWVLWDYVRRKDKRLVEEGTSVAPRYAAVVDLLR